MAAPSPGLAIGAELRGWRERRRMTQLDLALESGVSTRHLSFVETGRSQPGRETLLRIVKQLDVPLREQNRLLLAAGHAPAFPERSLGDPGLAAVRESIDLALAKHDPYPAVAFDRRWDMVAVNPALLALTESTRVDPVLLEPPINILRLSLHPRGLAPIMINLGFWHSHFCGRLERQVETTGSEDLRALLAEIRDYPVPPDRGGRESHEPESNSLGPLMVRAPDGGQLSFVAMFAIFDTPFEVTSSELAIELLFPADRATGQALEALARDRRDGA